MVADLLAAAASVLQWLCNTGAASHARITPAPPGGDDLQPAAPMAEVANVSPAPAVVDEQLPGKWSRADVLRYGELAQAAYDACVGGACRYGLRGLLPALGLAGRGYVATAFVYATVDLFPVVTVDDHRNWLAYVAVANDAERDRAGYRDIAVVWRGTGGPDELFQDLKARRVPLTGGDEERGVERRRTARGRPAKKVLVEEGFYSLYDSRCKTCKEHGTLSARRQVLYELRRLVGYLRARNSGETIRVTVTGHSLGGALAMLTAWDAAEALPAVPVRAVTFAAPRVGNRAFCDELINSRGVEVLRFEVARDVVPMVPFRWLGYEHAGEAIVLNADGSPFLKTLRGLWRHHNLRLYLHLVKGGQEEAVAIGQLEMPPAPELERDDRPLDDTELDRMLSSDNQASS